MSLIDAEKRLVGLIDIEVRPDVEAFESQVRQSTGDGGLTIRSQGRPPRPRRHRQRRPDRGPGDAGRPAGHGEPHPGQVTPAGDAEGPLRRGEPDGGPGTRRPFRIRRSADPDDGRLLRGLGVPRRASRIPGPGARQRLGTASPRRPAAPAACPSPTSSSASAARRISSTCSSAPWRRGGCSTAGRAEPDRHLRRARRVPGRGEYPIRWRTRPSTARRRSPSLKEFGVKLAFTPTVLRNGTINLQLERR